MFVPSVATFNNSIYFQQSRANLPYIASIRINETFFFCSCGCINAYFEELFYFM